MFKDYRWVYEKIQGTYVLKQGSSELWKVVDRDRNKFIAVRQGREQYFALKDLNLIPPKMGMVSSGLVCEYTFRMPKRHDWRQGLRSSNVFRCSCPRDQMTNNFGELIPNLEKTIAGEFDSLEKVIEKVQDKFICCPFSSEFALDDRGRLIYRNGLEVGDLDLQTMKSFKLKPEYEYLQESLMEAH